MKRTAIVIAFCCGVSVRAESLYSKMLAQRTTTVSVQVIDEGGQPIPGASVGIGYAGPGIDATTDTNGVVQYRDAATGSLACEVQKPGYYRTSGELWSGPFIGQPVPPTNQYTIVLKRVVNPAPLLRRDVEKLMPAGVQRCGFDLEACDWIAPYGKGTKEDVIVATEYENPSERNYRKKQTFEFPAPRSGIMAVPRASHDTMSARSALPVPQIAPESGYTNALRLEQSRLNSGEIVDNTKEHDVFLFQVRVQTNELGAITGRNVGWIANGFNLSGPMQTIRFRYYYNPDPTSRSLEPQKL